MTPVSTLERGLLLYARRFPVDRGKLRLINALWRTAAGRRGAQRTGHLAMGGFRVPCDLGDALSRQSYFFGTYYEDTVKRNDLLKVITWKIKQCFQNIGNLDNRALLK